MKRLNGWSVVVAFLSVAGCKSSGSGAPSTTADFCTQYADAVCQIATTRCGQTTQAGCVTYQESQCMKKAATATSEGGRVYTPGNAEACISQAHAAFGATGAITPSTLASIELAFQYTFQGKGKVLVDTCTNQFDCGGATDGSIVCADNGFCATKMTTPAASPCSDPGDVCATDTYCAANAAGLKVCTPAGMSGDACTATTPCTHDLRCASGTCTTLVDNGGACSADSDCSSAAPYCDPDAVPSPVCDAGLMFATGSPSCNCYATGACGGGTTGAGGMGGIGGGLGGIGGGLGGIGGGIGGIGGHAGLGGGGVGGGVGGIAGGIGGVGGGLGGIGGGLGGIGGTGLGGIGGSVL